MSIGIGAHANLIAEDKNTVMYEYGSYNLNDPQFRNENHLLDGFITMQRTCFGEPEIHEKVKKMPSGKKKLVIKRIPVDVEYGEMILDGRIVVENCSNTWRMTENELHLDVMALRLLFKIFRSYQEERTIPKVISLNV
ncbi:hypothetical protein ACQQ9V_11055 [Hornefia butyriciproducens]|uniref:hypothetical protein n=1 Tax=Hornefia butyriciproducens TaxID=2652293 RepID=UPI003D03E6CE